MTTRVLSAAYAAIACIAATPIVGVYEEQWQGMVFTLALIGGTVCSLLFFGLRALPTRREVGP